MRGCESANLNGEEVGICTRPIPAATCYDVHNPMFTWENEEGALVNL